MQVYTCTCNIRNNFHSSIPWHSMAKSPQSQSAPLHPASGCSQWKKSVGYMHGDCRNQSCIRFPSSLRGTIWEWAAHGLSLGSSAGMCHMFELCGGDLTYLPTTQYNHVLVYMVSLASPTFPRGNVWSLLQGFRGTEECSQFC